MATYNVRSMRDSVPALIRVIRAIRPDVLCLQEAPRRLGWRRRREMLARRTGMTVAAGRRRGGMAVLTGPGVRVLHAETRLLRPHLWLERRAAAIAVVEAGGLRLAVCSMHLDLEEHARLRHAREVVALVRDAAGRHGAAVVVAGDVNEPPGRPAFDVLTADLTDCYPCAPKGDGLTFPAARPRTRIDAIFAAPELTVLSCGVADADPADLAAATDHLPVVAELSAPEKRSS
ncbi:Metal-dependent hydrolase, endonuclease/exonuclease/phosphatase family [Thermostaphylospora chromogena]|uniref:Metal-dependent hydrolase, endonuclease/exonuclease/phosphatase family n=1 Tax=Thermostaphylospora chromogena TaxID=35622 RepID=A0A1H1G5M8_9ACTN|nr:Metal-dependent hydrolase, endonuclease/exonuclease/phosphatase family [Thermostaphylospora chromogena]